MLHADRWDSTDHLSSMNQYLNKIRVSLKKTFKNLMKCWYAVRWDSIHCMLTGCWISVLHGDRWDSINQYLNENQKCRDRQTSFETLI